jgi:WD40 repeat protein
MPVTCVNSSYDLERFVASSKDHSAIVWDVNQEEDEILYSLVGHKDIVVNLYF